MANLWPIILIWYGGHYKPMIGDRWEAVSEDAKDLVSQLLMVDPGARMSAQDILKHKWFSEDRITVAQARQVMGLGIAMGEESDNGRGSLKEGESVKRENDELKSGGMSKRVRIRPSRK